MSLTLVYPEPGSKPMRVKAFCPKHRRYDPSVEGRGGVIGGCKFCRLMLEIVEARHRADSAVRDMRVAAELLDAEIRRPRGK